MSIPNTQAYMFTRIPESIEIFWNKTTIACTDNKPVQYTSTKHSEALINKVELVIDFNQCLQDCPTSFDAMFDSDNGVAERWSQVRQDFDLIVKATQEAIETVIARQVKQARDNKMNTVDVINSRRTIPYFPSPRSDTNKSDTVLKSSLDKTFTNDKRMNHHPASVVSRVNTIHPEDSASMYPASEVRSILKSHSGTRYTHTKRSPKFQYVRMRQ
jgi:hypothetical protein